ncbi:hypothetical protein AgCh_000717 [Apium graveolens]
MFSFSERGPGFGLQDFVMANMTLRIGLHYCVDFRIGRLQLANGLQMTHVTLGNLQLVAQYLTVLGNLALSLHDTGQAQQLWPSHELSMLSHSSYIVSSTDSWYSGTVVECEGIYEARDSEGITSLCKGGSSSLQLKRAKASEKEA